MGTISKRVEYEINENEIKSNASIHDDNETSKCSSYHSAEENCSMTTEANTPTKEDRLICKAKFGSATLTETKPLFEVIRH